jgi:NADH dehydrogenase [ubiquinone] 1 alpha subcomplex assembly factor 1
MVTALLTGVCMTVSAAQNFELKASSTQWFVINDGVMGGVSSSSAGVVSGVLEFAGRVSLANNGGFASVRSSAGSYNLESTTSLILRVRGDGKRYGFQLGSSNVRGVLYRAEFDTKAGQWLEVKLPFTDFKPTRFGQVLSGYPLERGRIEHFGFIIANKKAETFKLELDWIRAF